MTFEEYLKTVFNEKFEDAGVRDVNIQINISVDIYGDYLNITLSKKGIIREYSKDIRDILFGNFHLSSNDIVNRFVNVLKQEALKQFLNE